MESTVVRAGGWDRRWVGVYAGLFVLVGVVHTTTDFGLLATLAGVAGLFFLLVGARSAWQALGSRSLERGPIGSLGNHAGAVEIDGTARLADETVTAPMTGTESVAYRVEVERWQPTSDHSD